MCQRVLTRRHKPWVYVNLGASGALIRLKIPVRRHCTARRKKSERKSLCQRAGCVTLPLTILWYWLCMILCLLESDQLGGDVVGFGLRYVHVWQLSGLFLGFDLDDEINIVSDCP
jgi:hypothetical protein